MNGYVICRYFRSKKQSIHPPAHPSIFKSVCSSNHVSVPCLPFLLMRSASILWYTTQNTMEEMLFLWWWWIHCCWLISSACTQHMGQGQWELGENPSRNERRNVVGCCGEIEFSVVRAICCLTFGLYVSVASNQTHHCFCFQWSCFHLVSQPSGMSLQAEHWILLCSKFNTKCRLLFSWILIVDLELLLVAVQFLLVGKLECICPRLHWAWREQRVWWARVWVWYCMR